jgi:hypothetical protein
MALDLSRTRLYHITGIANLGSVATRGLLSDVRLTDVGGPTMTIGYGNIKQKRMLVTRVECAGNRFVGEFVPFYFCPRSVMLYTVNIGRTGHPPGCQTDILHLVTTVQRALDTGHQWTYSDGNAGADYPNFYDDLAGLEANLNWEAINERANWSPVRTQKAAEFLVADTFPWSAIGAIGCYNQAAADRATAAIAGLEHQPVIRVRPDWYY